MLRRFNILVILFFVTLTLALAWRIFIYQKPLRVSTPKPKAAAVEATPSIDATHQSDLILELFNPTEADANAHRSADDLKRQIEEALVINFVLRRCDLVSSHDYGETYRALASYAHRAGLAATPEDAALEINRINAAASATYSLMYAKTKCDNPQLTHAAQQMDDWRKALLKP